MNVEDLRKESLRQLAAQGGLLSRTLGTALESGPPDVIRLVDKLTVILKCLRLLVAYCLKCRLPVTRTCLHYVACKAQSELLGVAPPSMEGRHIDTRKTYHRIFNEVVRVIHAGTAPTLTPTVLSKAALCKETFINRHFGNFVNVFVVAYESLVVLDTSE